MRSDDLAPLFDRDGPDIGYRQGRLTAYDPMTAEGTVRVAGSLLTNLPVMSGIEATSLAAGMVVGVLRVRSQYFILGRVVVPDSDAIVEQDLVINGAIRARLGDGLFGIIFGKLRVETTGAPSGHGLLVQAGEVGGVQRDIFRAKEDEVGDTLVYVGENGGYADEFIVGADNIALTNTDGRGFGSHSGDVIFNITRTTGSAANLHLSGATGAGFLARSTSSSRYKTDVEDHHVDPALVLGLRPRSWRDRSEVETDPDTSNRYAGLIAEEVDQAGLAEFVTYDEQGRPDSVMYDRLAIGLLEVVRQQQAQIASLTAWAATQGYRPPDQPQARHEPVKAVQRHTVELPQMKGKRDA